MKPTMELQCNLCGDRPPRNAVMESVKLHFNVEHDTDEIKLDLVAVCECGAAMEFVRSSPTGGGEFHYFHCNACGQDGRVRHNPSDDPI